MPRREEKKELPKLSDPAWKLQILAFENGLGDRTFEQYCYDEGFIFKKDYMHDYAINSDTLEAYFLAKQLNKDLETLKEQRHYMAKQDHINQIAPDLKCQPHSLDRKRCVHCWPWGFIEYFESIGRRDLIEKYIKLKQ